MRPIFFKWARVKPHSAHASVSSSSDTAFVFFCAAVSKRKPASWKPVGSVTPLSLEHLSHRFTCVIFPSTIWVRKTVASFSHMSHFITAGRIRREGLGKLLLKRKIGARNALSDTLRTGLRIDYRGSCGIHQRPEAFHQL